MKLEARIQERVDTIIQFVFDEGNQNEYMHGYREALEWALKNK